MKDYNTIGDLPNEVDCLDSFADYSGYVCDAIAEIADSHIPVYNSDVWQNVYEVKEHTERAIEEGIAPTEGTVDLVKIFQSGYYLYYTESLNHNLDELAFNYVANKVNEHLNTLEDTSGIDIDEIESEIESATLNFDHNKTFDDMDDIADGIVERIEDNEFEA